MSNDTDVVSVIEEYLEHLGNSEFEEAIEFFTADCSYIHSPVFKGEIETRGRDELLTYFEDVRGPKDVEFNILDYVTDGERIGFFSTAEGDVANDYFLGYAVLSGGLIRKYIVGTI